MISQLIEQNQHEFGTMAQNKIKSDLHRFMQKRFLNQTSVIDPHMCTQIVNNDDQIQRKDDISNKTLNTHIVVHSIAERVTRLYNYKPNLYVLCIHKFKYQFKFLTIKNCFSKLFFIVIKHTETYARNMLNEYDA